MSNFTFLTKEQCLGNDKLDILEKRGTRAVITDFSILLGGYVSDDYQLSMDIIHKKQYRKICKKDWKEHVQHEVVVYQEQAIAIQQIQENIMLMDKNF